VDAQRPAGPASRVRTLRVVLRRADFRRLFATRIASQTADGVFQASLAGAVLFNPERAATPAQVAAGFAVLLLPYSVVGPFAGVLIDRWRRQRILVLASLFRCLAVAVVAVLIGTGVGGFPLYLSALVVVSANRFILSALSAALPHVVDPPTLITANALSTTIGTVVTTVGGGLALLVRLGVGSNNSGYAVIAISSAAGYALAAAAARGFDRDLLGPDNAERSRRETVGDVVRGLVAGARHVRRLPQTAYALAAIGAHRFFYGISTIATLLLYRNYFHDEGFFRAGLAGLGQAFAAAAVGVLLAALVTPAATRRVGKPAWIAIVFALAALTEATLGLPFRMQTLVPAGLLLAFVAQGSKICVDTIVQETVEDEFRGRVFSFYDTLFNVTFVAAAVVGAIVLPPTGRSYPVLALIAAGYAVTALLYGSASRGYSGRSPATPPPVSPSAGTARPRSRAHR
jgi:MFS family permease